MNDVKLRDFTDEELKELYIAVGLAMLKATPKKKDILERWQTQILHAAGIVALEDRIKSN